jgi:hypothetical protein
MFLAVDIVVDNNKCDSLSSKQSDRVRDDAVNSWRADDTETDAVQTTMRAWCAMILSSHLYGESGRALLSPDCETVAAAALR